VSENSIIECVHARRVFGCDCFSRERDELIARAEQAEARVAFLEKHCEVVEARVAELDAAIRYCSGSCGHVLRAMAPDSVGDSEVEVTIDPNADIDAGAIRIRESRPSEAPKGEYQTPCVVCAKMLDCPNRNWAWHRKDALARPCTNEALVPELDSPPFKPEALTEFEKRGYERVNRPDNAQNVVNLPDYSSRTLATASGCKVTLEWSGSDSMKSIAETGQRLVDSLAPRSETPRPLGWATHKTMVRTPDGTGEVQGSWTANRIIEDRKVVVLIAGCSFERFESEVEPL
jgi:hypothetical protein